MLRHHKLIFADVRHHTESWVQPATFEVVTAFVQGYDAACEFGVLSGFREWLIVRARSDRTNFVWDAYVLSIAFPKVHLPCWEALTTEEAHRHAIDTMFALIEEFDETVSKPDGRNEITRAYDKWVQELKAEDRLVEQALDAVVGKYPNLGFIEDYSAVVQGQDERVTIRFFKQTTEGDRTLFAVVTMENGKITSISEKPNGE
jgi:hypothetical protein